MAMYDGRKVLYTKPGWVSDPLAEGFVPVNAVGKLRPCHAFVINIPFDRMASGTMRLSDIMYTKDKNDGDPKELRSAHATATLLAAILAPLRELGVPSSATICDVPGPRRGVVIELVRTADGAIPHALRVWMLIFDTSYQPRLVITRMMTRNCERVRKEAKRKLTAITSAKAPLDPASGLTLFDTAQFARTVGHHLLQSATPHGNTAGADGAQVLANDSPTLPRALCAVGDFAAYLRRYRGCTHVEMNDANTFPPLHDTHRLDPAQVFNLSANALQACAPGADVASCQPRNYLAPGGLVFTQGRAWAYVDNGAPIMTTRLPRAVSEAVKAYQKQHDLPLSYSFANRVRYVALGKPA